MRKFTRIGACLVASLLLIAAVLCVGCSSDMYSEEKHMQRIRERAEERFLGEDSEYTGLEVYPIYNEYDELKYALIEFEPQGFVYVYISEREYPWSSMYSLSDTESERWIPYRVKEGAQEEIIDVDGKLYGSKNCEYIRDENGQVIIYNESHFKVAGIENERRYFLSTIPTVYIGHSRGRIPAVKRGEQYLDLVDGAMIDYTPGMESAYAIADVVFFNKAHFDL
mgnify:CR=1 FL=1